MSDDQDQITATLAERSARKRDELQLGPPAERPDMATETRNAVCACGAPFTQNVLSNGPQEIVMPIECEVCRVKRTGREIAATAQARTDRADTQREMSLKARWAMLDIPPYWLEATLDTFEHHGEESDQRLQMRALSFARRYLAQWPAVQTFTVFQGSFGTGKGHVVWAMAKHLVEAGATARVVKLPGLVRQLRDTWRRDSGITYEQVLAKFTEPDFLVIDEASRHAFYGQQIHQHLYDVVDSRIELCRPTIITTNEDQSGLEEVLRPALFNRLQGEGGRVPFGNASWRSRPREASA